MQKAGSPDKMIPRHIGIIMDGNGRWAQKNKLPRSSGHAKGAEVFQTIARYCEEIGIEALTVFAFSTENWSRSKDEVDSIMSLLRKYLKDAFRFKGEEIRVRFIGLRNRIPKDLCKLMDEIEEATKNKTGLKLNVAIDYGGRTELVCVVQKLVRLASEGVITAEQIDEATIDALMETADCPPLDLILRPSGEQRISNFLLWQCAYSEFVFMDTLWPDFTPELLDQAILEFRSRSRRFGGR